MRCWHGRPSAVTGRRQCNEVDSWVSTKRRTTLLTQNPRVGARCQFHSCGVSVPIQVLRLNCCSDSVVNESASRQHPLAIRVSRTRCPLREISFHQLLFFCCPVVITAQNQLYTCPCPPLISNFAHVDHLVAEASMCLSIPSAIHRFL